MHSYVSSKLHKLKQPEDDDELIILTLLCATK